MKKIEQALNLAQAEIRALYKRVGYSNSSVLTLIDEALDQVKTCNKPAVINNEGLASSESVAVCPTCGSQCYIGGTDGETRYFIPVHS